MATLPAAKYFPCLIMVAVLVTRSLAFGADLEAQSDGLVERVVVETPKFESVTPGGVYWQKEIQKIGTLYLRLHLASVEGSASENTVLSLYDRDGQPIRRYSGTELQERVPLWTPVIPGDYVLISLQSEHVPAGFNLKIDQIAYQAYAGAPLSTWGEDEKKHIAEYSELPVVMDAARSVAKLSFLKAGRPRICTGFLIGQKQLMTNHHCVDDQETCDSVTAMFGYQYSESGLLSFGEQYECERINSAKMDYALDYSILELKGTPGTKWGSLNLKAADPAENEALFIIQHPAGEPKQVSMINCNMLKVPVEGRSDQSDFTHTCDTAGGSSGAPVLDDNGEVLGLHHYGFGERLEVDWTENRAVRINKVIGHMGD